MRNYGHTPAELQVIFIIAIVLIILTCMVYMKRQSVLQNGHDGTATFVRSGAHRGTYFVVYQYTDENGEERLFKDPYIFDKFQVDKLKQMGSFPIKFIGGNAAVVFDFNKESQV
jgi:competence protein ComGC